MAAVGRRSLLFGASFSEVLRRVVTVRPALALGVLVFVVALAFRLPDLGASCNIDALLYWFGRTRKFWTALAEGRWSETYFSPHPGVSIMWLSGAWMQHADVLHAPVSERSVVAATTPLAILASVVPAASVPLLFRILTTSTGSKAEPRLLGEPLASGPALFVAGLAGALLATEPFLVAHARTFHLDSTTTGCVWVGSLLGLLALLERRFAGAIAGGICFGVALLTRMPAAAFVGGIGLPFVFSFLLERPRSPRLLVLGLVLGVTALVTTFVLWPALLTSPTETIDQLLRQTRGTVDRGHPVFSWGEIHARDPGPALYAGVALMRLSPEILGLGLLAPFLLRRSPRRTLVVLASLACAYLPAAIALFTSTKKGDRYALPFFPLVVFVAVVCLVEAARRLPALGRFAARRRLVVGSVVALLVAVRALRLWAIHPVPVAWCATYPGLACEDVLTLGEGEGFRDAALWIAENSPVEQPSILSAYAGGMALGPWLRFRRVRHGEDAHFVVTYLASDQRDRDPATRKFAVGTPVHEVRYQNRPYVKIFLGPKHPERARQRRRRPSD